MTENRNLEKRTLCLHPRMIGAGMTHPASVFTATILVAVRRSKLFSEISNLHGVRGPIFVNLLTESSGKRENKKKFVLSLPRVSLCNVICSSG